MAPAKTLAGLGQVRNPRVQQSREQVSRCTAVSGWLNLSMRRFLAHEIGAVAFEYRARATHVVHMAGKWLPKQRVRPKKRVSPLERDTLSVELADVRAAFNVSRLTLRGAASGPHSPQFMHLRPMLAAAMPEPCSCPHHGAGAALAERQ